MVPAGSRHALVAAGIAATVLFGCGAPLGGPAPQRPGAVAAPSRLLRQGSSPAATPAGTATGAVAGAVRLQAGAAAATPPAGPIVAVRTPARATRQQRWSPGTTGAAALALIRYPWRRLGYRVRFLGPRRGIQAMVDREARTIDVYVRRGQSVRSVAYVVAHEIGHAVDFALLRPTHRDAWLRERGISGARWFPCNACSDYASGAGDFAEVFAVLQVGPVDFRSRLAPCPGRTALDRLRQMVPMP